LVLPVAMSSSPFPGEDHPPVPPTTPVFDAFAYLSYLAGRTERIRLGTHVYNLALRSPFVAARAVQPLDIVSGRRAEVGSGRRRPQPLRRPVPLRSGSSLKSRDEPIMRCAVVRRSGWNE